LPSAAVERGSAVCCGDCEMRTITAQPATAEIERDVRARAPSLGLATEALAAVIIDLFLEVGPHRAYGGADD
jgi:hypothetical protein